MDKKIKNEIKVKKKKKIKNEIKIKKETKKMRRRQK